MWLCYLSAVLLQIASELVLFAQQHGSCIFLQVDRALQAVSHHTQLPGCILSGSKLSLRHHTRVYQNAQAIWHNGEQVALCSTMMLLIVGAQPFLWCNSCFQTGLL